MESGGGVKNADYRCENLTDGRVPLTVRVNWAMAHSKPAPSGQAARVVLALNATAVPAAELELLRFPSPYAEPGTVATVSSCVAARRQNFAIAMTRNVRGLPGERLLLPSADAQ